MPVRNGYNLVDDIGDSQVPVHNEEAFQHGIHFQAKYVGSLNMPRPGSRVEIVAAMRRIRNEFKAKCIKKKKVNIVISVDGVKVVLWKKQKRKEWTWDEAKMLVMHDPVYRIFYVSHDSRELKIFSYIARDGSSSSFRCNVFKTKKKAQAVCIVRTLGQAFEVCHQLSLQRAQQQGENQADGESGEASTEGHQWTGGENDEKNGTEKKLLKGLIGEVPGILESSYVLKDWDLQDGEQDLLSVEGALCSLPPRDPAASTHLSLSNQHHLHLLQHQLLQQQTQTHVALAQVQLLQGQLAAEAAARLEAESQIQQLQLHNRELLQHVALLVKQLRDLESRVPGTIQDGGISRWGSAGSLILRNHGLENDEAVPSTGLAEDPTSPSAPAALAESYLSLLSLENEAQTEARRADTGPVGSGGRQDKVTPGVAGNETVRINSRTIRRVTEWFHHTVPKLNPPPPIMNRKRANKLNFLGRTKSNSKTVAIEMEERVHLQDIKPCDASSLGNSESESCSTSEDSGVVRSEKCPHSPQHEGPFENQGPCLSAASSCSGRLEDPAAFRSASVPLLPPSPVVTPGGPASPSSLYSLAHKTCLHISLSEDELMHAKSLDLSISSRK
ncbi:carboxyl-terminal PDZ ligand of neuronal nitric oxide synthase protein-like isoform X2 [Brienomyrus brachyistius]|uniref:carboxyl-terminal PDZ ligand of neuronal nitric oxide synthase protein-like isoform X2 n=1 Tax=Brienomyrus brachyistius TaxID=42636 RepID=UPI0020B26861|nr:carboxyl-terminal PDZ ligand of neuronal nitric oxide synthase protein-like isoform X2 [Brienomyrus brachyistius]